jgi:hypothetical protein
MFFPRRERSGAAALGLRKRWHVAQKGQGCGDLLLRYPGSLVTPSDRAHQQLIRCQRLLSVISRQQTVCNSALRHVFGVLMTNSRDLRTLVPKAHALGRETFDSRAYTAQTVGSASLSFQTGDGARLPEMHSEHAGEPYKWLQKWYSPRGVARALARSPAIYHTTSVTAPPLCKLKV